MPEHANPPEGIAYEAALERDFRNLIEYMHTRFDSYIPDSEIDFEYGPTIPPSFPGIGLEAIVA